MRGEYKINFDAAFKDGVASSRVVLLDEHGIILGAWTNHFQSENPFCAEAEVVVQALKVAEQLNLDKISIKGDAHNVVMALTGSSEFDDWRAKKILDMGKTLLHRRLIWFLSFVPFSSNLTAHSLAIWAFNSFFLGKLISPFRSLIFGRKDR